MDGARVVRFFENGVHLIRHTPLPTANWPPYALLLLNDASSVNSVATLLSIRTNTTFGSIQTSSFIAAPWVVKEYRGLVSHVVKLRFVNQLNFHLSDPVTDRPSTRFPGPIGQATFLYMRQLSGCAYPLPFFYFLVISLYRLSSLIDELVWQVQCERSQTINNDNNYQFQSKRP